MQKLTGKQARYLRSLGHHLSPVVMIGKEGLNEKLVESTREALEAHELIKVKLQEGCLLDRREASERLAQETGAAVAQVLGKTFLLFKPSKEKKIDLP